MAEMALRFRAIPLVKTRLLASHAMARLSWLSYLARSPARLLRRLSGGRPRRLLIALQDIRTADPIAAEDIYAGHFSLAGKAASTHGHSPFTILASSLAWSQALHGFGWLRHLRAADTALSRANARALVEEWLNLEARGRFADVEVANNPSVVARRLISWLSQSPIILESAEHRFYRRFVRAVEAHAAALEHALAGQLEGEARLTAIIALTQAALCLEAATGLLRRALALLARELAKQILRDGGHISRNPRVLVDLLLDLLPTRQAFVARNIAAPETLLNAIDRMTPMLRMFRHWDGALAGFNGMGVSEPGTLATLLAHGDVGGAAILEASYSGYQRLEAADSIVVADVGAPPPPKFSGNAHAGCLSFEFSSGLHRIIVNCGEAQVESNEAHDAARASAAHSTLIIDDHSSCRFEPAGSRSIAAGLVLSGPSYVEVTRSVDETVGESIDAVHDGYAHGYGALHRRILRLAGNGASLTGEDWVLAARKAGMPPDTSLAVRFHLHPAVRVEPDAETGHVFLLLPSGEEWRFASDGRPIEIEESIFFAAPGGARPTLQLVLRGNLIENEAFHWYLDRSRPPDDLEAANGGG
jgi:uncharacterized heparinase superfamily protein